MNITRRAALVGTAASIAIARMAHAAPPLTPSPFLRVYDGTADMIRVSAVSMQPIIPLDLAQFYAGKLDVPSPRLPQFVSYTVTAADGIAVASMEEAEDRVIDLIPNPTMHAQIPSEHRPFYCGDGMVSLPIVINRSSNLICIKTQSRIADTVLVSPEALKIISDNDYFGGGTYYAVPERTVGRWTHVGRLHYAIDVFVGDHLPTDRVFLMRASEDDHAVLIRSDAGLYLVTDPAPITTQVAQATISWGQSRDFFKSVGFERV